MTNDGLPSVTCRRDKESSHAEPSGGPPCSHAPGLRCACCSDGSALPTRKEHRHEHRPLNPEGQPKHQRVDLSGMEPALSAEAWHIPYEVPVS